MSYVQADRLQEVCGQALQSVNRVLSTSGDTHLGGDDLDKRVVDFIAEEFKKQYGIDLREDPMAHQRLREAAEKAKCELSTVMSSDINLPFITADASGPKHLQMSISRAQFEQMVESLVEKTRGPCEQALRDANLTAKDIDEVILVGGSTRVPLVQALVKEIFGKDPNKTVNPDEVVALGAAIQGAVLSGDVQNFLLRRAPRDNHALLAMLQRLDEGSLVHQRRLTIPFVKQILGL